MVACHESPLVQNPTSLLPRSRQKSCMVGRVRDPHSPQSSPSTGPVISTEQWPATSSRSFKTLQVYFRDRVKRVVWLAASKIHTARSPPRRPGQSSPPNDGPPRVPARLKPYKFTSAIASKELYGWPRPRSTQPAVPPRSTGPVISTKQWPATSSRSFKTLQVYFRDRVKRVVWLVASSIHTARSPPGVDRTSHLHQTMACHEFPLV
jgi:hypothetical protein